MFDSGKNKYASDIKLGERYRDEQTGFEGHATALCFNQHGCERVDLEAQMPDMSIKAYAFDAPRLVHIATGVRAQSPRPGGPTVEASREARTR